LNALLNSQKTLTLEHETNASAFLFEGALSDPSIKKNTATHSVLNI
jgi:hypothetical protein